MLVEVFPIRNTLQASLTYYWLVSLLCSFILSIFPAPPYSQHLCILPKSQLKNFLSHSDL